MNKRTRQYTGLLSAIVCYYGVHEGAHLLYALSVGAFKKINFLGLGIQVDVYAERLSQTQLGIFCLLGSVATLLLAYLLVLGRRKIVQSTSKVRKACGYYITIAMLLLDPLYLSLLCGFFGGGDLNGISMLMPEIAARCLYGMILAVNIALLVKLVYPCYKAAFTEEPQS